jgi:hypothetical protein
LPLLFALSHDTRFHLLALSQHHVRLLHCTQQRVELEMARGFPVSLEAWMNTRRPDHVLASRSSAGPSVGAMKGVVSGMSADREREDEYLRHFFIEVDKGVIGHLRSQAEPLVLAGVEYELAIYRRINSYSATLDQSVNGSPDGVSDRTLHARAMEVVMSVYSEPVQKALADLHEFLGTARSSTDPRTVVQAAFQGRVMDLLIPANAEFRGTWNDAMQDVEAGDEDLVNAAAVQTIRHGGSAFVLKETDMPVKTPMAALFRF